MTYKTRQEVLSAAADWMDTCVAAGVEATCKHDGVIKLLCDMAFPGYNEPCEYEFPLALLEGKEVWVGSELYHMKGHKYTVQEIETFSNGRQAFRTVHAPWIDGDYIENYSWNPPKPKTVMVEMLVEDAEWLASFSVQPTMGCASSAGKACKKALEKL